MSLFLGESEEAVAHSLGRSLHLPKTKEERARAVAAIVARVVRELDLMERAAWLE